MRMRLFLALWAPFLLACGAGSADAGFGGDGNGGASGVDAGVSACLSSNECPTGFVCNDFGRCERPPSTDGGVTPPPPEVEYEFGAPISSERYVYVAMTAQDSLARIDGRTLAVTSTSVGESPREVAAIPGSDGAVVLDSINGTATLVRPNGTTNTTRVLATLPNLNRLDVDPSGRYAVVWFDLARQIQMGGIGGVGSFQDVTVIALEPGHEVAVDLTVGFRPRNVQFDATGNRAYVVTQDGVSVIDLAFATQNGPSIVPPIPVADLAIPPEAIEVNILSTGEYAAVRQSGLSKIRIVGVGSTERGVTREISLASPATDIDLSPDGARVYAVEREAKLLAIIDVPGDALDPTGVQTIDLSTATVGSFVLSRDGRRALMFTNATLDERITLIKLDAPGFPQTTWPLKKAVRAVGISPTGDSAIVLAAKAPGDPATATSVDDFIDKSYGYALLDLASGFAKLQITPVDPGAFVYAPDGTKAYVALDGGDAITATRQLQVINTHTGVVITKPLGSPPSAVGILPGAGTAFVAQRHPLGRVSFLDLVTSAVHTVTGFDLNSQIVN
jgi:DNA-binding beta-propeller fold protein YncE